MIMNLKICCSIFFILPEFRVQYWLRVRADKNLPPSPGPRKILLLIWDSILWPASKMILTWLTRKPVLSRSTAVFPMLSRLPILPVLLLLARQNPGEIQIQRTSRHGQFIVGIFFSFRTDGYLSYTYNMPILNLVPGHK